MKISTSEDEAVVTPKVGQAPLTPAAAKEVKEKRGQPVGKLSFSWFRS